MTDNLVNQLVSNGLILFLAVVAMIASYHFSSLFWDWHGWRHRMAGGLHLVWLLVGSLTIPHQVSVPAIAALYDALLGILGIAASLTAASDFPHRYVSNNAGQSGTLSEKAMVTQNEMIEHAFYQFLNLWQALYLNFSALFSPSNRLVRLAGLFLVTAPWLFRHRVPVHSFSNNWILRPKHAQSSYETILYRLKKAQYLFYKHGILHGINLTVAVAGDPTGLVGTRAWRIFWICLNAAYVMEFFLQSLVRRKVIAQATMLRLNGFLMIVSSVAAAQSVLLFVRWELAVASLLLNIYHRKRDVFNTVAIGSLAVLQQRKG